MTPRLPPEKRGLGHDHRRQRQRLLNILIAKEKRGTVIPCWWCGQPMHSEPSRNPDGRPLEADHSRARSVHGIQNNPADRLLHHRCNRERGDGTKDDQRPALGRQRDGMVDKGPLGRRAMPWPQKTP